MTRKTISFGLLWLFFVLPFFHSVAESQERPDQPNIVIIFTDDQGYEDVGVYGAEGFDTPNLDRMAQEGLKMNSFYVSTSVCTPSRNGLLTGSYPPRNNVTGVLFPRDSKGLHPDEITIADLLKQQGYATAAVGKWHLGHKEPFLPMNQGFDRYYGIPYSNDMNHDPSMDLAEDARLRNGLTRDQFQAGKNEGPPIMEGKQVVEWPAEQSTLTRRYTKRSVEFIREHQDQPFFLYLAHTMPHVPLAATEKFAGRTERGLYGDVIREIDWSTGQVLQTLKNLNLAEETLVLFTSDNGPWLSKGDAGGSADPLRDGKFSVYEGGMRMPAIFWWPEQIPAGTESSEIVSTIDMLPTIAELSGVETPSDRTIDGKDVSNVLFQPETADSPHEFYCYYNGDNLKAIRSGKWKLHLNKGELYNLKQDISESNNVADDHPEVVKEMTSMANSFNEKLRENERPAARSVSSKSDFKLEAGETRNRGRSPAIRNRPFEIEAELDHNGEEGVIVAQGGTVVGFTLYVKNDRVHFGIRKNSDYSEISSSAPLSDGSVKLHVKLSENGTVEVRQNGNPFFSDDLSVVPTMPQEGINAGLDANGNVGPYDGDFSYSGELKEVIVRLPNLPDKPYEDEW